MAHRPLLWKKKTQERRDYNTIIMQPIDVSIRAQSSKMESFCILLLGVSAWITINSVYQELFIIANRAPEGYALATYIAFVVQAGNIVPLAYKKGLSDQSRLTNAALRKASFAVLIASGMFYFDLPRFLDQRLCPVNSARVGGPGLHLERISWRCFLLPVHIRVHHEHFRLPHLFALLPAGGTSCARGGFALDDG